MKEYYWQKDPSLHRICISRALVAFTQKQADLVKENKEKVELEPMGAADRKIVHDAAAEISGITSSSNGEEPRRYVVLHPSE